MQEHISDFAVLVLDQRRDELATTHAPDEHFTETTAERRYYELTELNICVTL
jgi:hypothetical protein